LALNPPALREMFAPGVPSARRVPTGPAEQGAAVLVVLEPGGCGESGRADAIVFIRRAKALRANPGEIAFPGGRIEPQEAPLAAALREAGEEVGLAPDGVEVLGELPIVEGVRRPAPILPVVALAPRHLELEANPSEVERILVVPVAELLTPGCYWSEQWDRDNDPAWRMHFFFLGEDVIWGATAEMVYVLLERLVTWRDEEAPS